MTYTKVLYHNALLRTSTIVGQSIINTGLTNYLINLLFCFSGDCSSQFSSRPEVFPDVPDYNIVSYS
jgi:hypothetical protein